MPLTRLPVELLLDILTRALHDHPCPANIICVNRLISRLSQVILYSALRFRTVGQLALFAALKSPLVCPPKSFVITLVGGIAMVKHLAEALRRCQACVEATKAEPAADFRDAGPVPLDLLSLCLHSYTRSPDQQSLYDALALANPKRFVWTGPDPSNHHFIFTTATVPAATFHLFRAIRTWTAIQHITLTSLSFPSDQLGPGMQVSMSHDTPLLPVIPSLRTLYLGQASQLSPGAIAAMMCLPGQDKLELVRLVDAYQLSIWGPRIRRRDIEQVALSNLDSEAGEEEREAAVAKVRRLVRCEAKTDGIMGGDLVGGPAILE